MQPSLRFYDDRIVVDDGTVMIQFIKSANMFSGTFVDQVHPDAEVKRFIGLINKETGLMPMESCTMQDGKKLHVAAFKVPDTDMDRARIITLIFGLSGVKPEDIKPEMKLVIESFIHPKDVNLSNKK